jgi:hypothetical protein
MGERINLERENRGSEDASQQCEELLRDGRGRRGQRKMLGM